MKSFSPNVHWKTFLAAILASLAAACGSHGSGGGLSVSARAVSDSTTPTPSGLLLPSGITLHRIRMAVQRVSVEGNCAVSAAMHAAGATDGTSAASGSQGDGDDGCELSFGPFGIDLDAAALTTTAVSFAFDAPVPAGTYEEVEVKVNTVPAEHAGADPTLLALAAAHASILVEGAMDEGTAGARSFAFATPVEVVQEREGTIVVGEGGNVTLGFDPSLWFGTAGARLDPNDPTNQGQILANIRASIRLVKDDDRNGCDDGGPCAAGSHP